MTEKKTNNGHGGKRAGAGRPALDGTRRISICLTEATYPEFKRRGGAVWLRQELLRKPQKETFSDQELEEVSDDVCFPAADLKPLRIPVYEYGVQTGFPSPAESYIDRSLDLNDFLIPNPAATFFVYVSGDSMNLAGMDDGDLLIVDRSLEPKNDDIVIMSIDNEFTVKRFEKLNSGIRLMPESSNPVYKPISPKGNEEWRFIGVVTHTIKNN